MNININNNTDITKIRNNYILKSLFSYINSKNILKLVQKNKNLQNRLNINIENYKNKFEFPKYKFDISKNIVEKPNERYKQYCGKIEDFFGVFGQCISSCTTCIFSLYLLVYILLLNSLDTFDDSNTKKNYDKSLENIINKINRYLFILLGCVLVSWAILCFFILVECLYDKGFKKIIKSILIIIINMIHFVFEGLVIWKLCISYKIIEGDIPWFMKMDYSFLIINFIHILFLIILTIGFFKDSESHILLSALNLISFNNNQIKEYNLPENFSNWTEKERKQYLLDNCVQFKYINSKMLSIWTTSDINDYRKELKLPRLNDGKNVSIQNFIENEPGEMLLYPEKNIFKLSNKEYLFKYPIGEFEKKVKNKDKEVMDILIKDNLQYIIIIFALENDEYILVYEESDNNIFNLKKNNDKDIDSLNIGNNNELKQILLDENEE